ncbi:MAG: ribosome-associated translation inhibitor RaiA [Patescibacteria group bacterium]
MKITIKTTHFAHTPALENYVNEKIGRLDRYLKNLQLAKVELEYLSEHKTKEKFRAEANIDAPGHVFYAESWARDMYAAVDLLEEKLIAQMDKFKEKRIQKNKKVIRKIKEDFI